MAAIAYQRTIPLTKGKETIVDDDDFFKYGKSKWCASWNGSKWYATSKNGFLHRLILRVPAGFVVDHINGDTLDNRKSNLRICTQQQNSFNSRSKNPISGYKGVYKNKKKWHSQLMIDGKHIVGGSFASPLEAAQSYDKLAEKYFGEFAKKNFQ